MVLYVLYGWLVVSTHLKNTSQIGNLPQIGGENKNMWNHQLDGYEHILISILYL